MPYCSECGGRFDPAPHNAQKQETCGTVACKIAHIKRLATYRPERHRVQTMSARAKERARQRELEYSLAGFGAEPCRSIIDKSPR